MREYGVSQVPVVRAEPPITAGEVVGSVGEKQLLDALFKGTAALADALERHMSPPLPIIGSGESVTEAVAALSTADALLVHVDGKPAGVITRQDLLGHLAGSAPYIGPVCMFRGPDRGTCMRLAGRRGYGERMSGFNTRAIHAGQEPDPLTGAVTVPIYATSTFKQDGVGGLRGGYEYSRSANPTRTALEVALAALEADSARGLAFASGLAAEDTLLRALCRPGDHVVLPDDAYGGTFRLIARVLDRWGLEHTAVPLANRDAVRAAVRPAHPGYLGVRRRRTRCSALPTWPRWPQLAHDAQARLVVDNTFATPYLQQPIADGADVVVHSTTKYLGGHSDVIGGALVTADLDLAQELDVPPERDGRDRRSLRCVAGVAWPEDARGAHGPALRQCRAGSGLSARPPRDQP